LQNKQESHNATKFECLCTYKTTYLIVQRWFHYCNWDKSSYSFRDPQRGS